MFVETQKAKLSSTQLLGELEIRVEFDLIVVVVVVVNNNNPVSGIQLTLSALSANETTANAATNKQTYCC